MALATGVMVNLGAVVRVGGTVRVGVAVGHSVVFRPMVKNPLVVTPTNCTDGG